MNRDETFERGKRLISQGLFHAALDVLHGLESASTKFCPESELYNELGKAYLFLADYHEAVKQFTKAIAHANCKESWVRYNVNLAHAYKRLSEFDTSYRCLQSLLEYMHLISPQVQGALLLNLSAIYGISGFYEQAIDCAQQSLAAYSKANVHAFDDVIYNNLGMAYLEIGDYDSAENYFKKALTIVGPTVDMIAELGRLSLLRGELHESIEYATRSITMVWPSIITYEKEEIARLCYLLANIAVRMKETELALRLAEKAQVFYGQLGMWCQWQDIDFQMSEWIANPSDCSHDVDVTSISFVEIRRFLSCLDALNSQELIHKKVSNLLDTRVHYTKLLAHALHLSEQDQEDLVLASRFADYGLTALESEVILNPHRSEQAFEQFKQHPSLSVQMMKTLHLPERIANIVADHHENYDGTGFPSGKKGDGIHYLARVFSVADKYATGVVLEGKTHSEVMSGIVSQGGKALDPDIVDTFKSLFEENRIKV